MDETTLRYILLFVGAIIILGILWDGLRRKKKSQFSPMASFERNDSPSQIEYKNSIDFDSNEPSLNNSALDNIVKNDFWDNLPKAVLDQFEISDEREKINTNDVDDDEEEEMEETEEEETSKEVESEIEGESEEKEEEEFAEEEQQKEEPKQEQKKEEEEKKEDKENDDDESNTAMALSLESEELPQFQRAAYVRPDKFIMLHVMAPQGKTFGGYDLLQTLLSHGLRYGDMQIFHKYSEGTLSKQKKLFSLASATEPGDFNLNRIGGFSCKGLVLFMNIKDQDSPVKAFDEMFSTAAQLSEDLGGELLLRDTGAYTTSAITMIREELSKYI